MTYWQSLILGVVEGFTEFLPISSTAHLILTGKILSIPQSEFVKSFEITIQFGAILAIVWLYWKKLLIDTKVLKKITVAFLPTAILGFLLYEIFKGFLMENLYVVVLTLLLGGIFLIIFEYWHKEKTDASDEIEKISYRNCLLIGLCQSVAIIPGVSRAATTILGGLYLGIRRKTIVEFSFLLAVPTMLAATGFDLLKSGFNFSNGQLDVLLIGFVTSFLVAILAVKFLLRYIQQNDFKSFGIYRISIGLIFLLAIL